MNLLEVRYEEDGTRRFYRDGEEVSEDVWRQQHPHLREGKDSGRARITDGDNGDAGQVSAERSEAQSSQGRQRAKDRAAQAERARRSDHELGQSRARPESPRPRWGFT